MDAARAGIAQVAISSLDGVRSHDWYARGLGYLPAGGRQPTADLSAVQGVPNAQVASLHWLVDRQEFFQLEIFQYASPDVRPQPADRRASDIGYASIGVWVADLDATLGALARLGTSPLSAPAGPPGARRVCVLDPDGVLVELREDYLPAPDAAEPARPSAGVATRSVTVSVPNLEHSMQYFAGAIGMRPAAGVVLHTGEHEALWGLRGARARRAVLGAGDLWLEVVQYLDPVGRPRPAGYRITDQGILNIAVASRSLAGFARRRDEVVRAGYQVHEEIARDRLHIQYVADRDGFSVEMAYFHRSLDAVQGFVPVEANRAGPR